VPMCILYEMGIWLGRFYQPKPDEDETAEESDEPTAKIENKADQPRS
jgi:sec-independent protein translocase protein TatC